jgi:cell division protein FtsQ
VLREQVITPRNAKGAQTRGTTKTRSATKTQRAAAGRANVSTSRRIAGYLPLAAKLLFVVCAILFAVAVYRAAGRAAFFEIRRIDVNSTSGRVSTRDVEATVRRVAGTSGVWNADLSRISEEVERLTWVRAAIVTRVLPTGLRIRISEREPRAVVRLSESGRLAWVDTEGVVLGAVTPTDRMPPFFVRGWNEARTESANRENRERIARYTEMLRAWEAAGFANRISEVNLEDLRDVRVELAGADSNIEVRLGGEDFGNRLRYALQELDRQRQTTRGAFISYLDTTVERRVIVGFNPNAVPNARTEESENRESASEETRRSEAPNNRTRERATERNTAAAERTEVNSRTRNERQRNENARREPARDRNAARSNETTSRREPNERPRRAVN